MNKELQKYITKYGNEIVCNRHLYFVLELMRNSNTDWSSLYRLSSYMYAMIKLKSEITLNETIEKFNTK